MWILPGFELGEPKQGKSIRSMKSFEPASVSTMTDLLGLHPSRHIYYGRRWKSWANETGFVNEKDTALEVLTVLLAQ